MMNLPRPSTPDSPSLFGSHPVGKAALVGALIACATVSLTGCSKKEPPPPPPVVAPPPPPPPPTVISFDSISQELKAHAAVQYAPNLEVSDESLVRATVKLADALARGDASKVRALVSKPAERVIREMESSGVWEPGMADVEAVRVVYAGPVDANSNHVTLENVIGAMTGKPDSEIPGMTPELQVQITTIFAKALAVDVAKNIDPANVTPESAEKLAKSIQQNLVDMGSKFLTDSKYESARKEIEDLIVNLKGNADLPSGEFLVLLAVQHKDGAELSGWGAEKAFGKWQFNNGTTVASTKPRASEFDNIGLAGFTSRLAEAPKADAGDAKPGEGKPEEAKPEEGKPKKEDEPSGPTKKRTPAGPVTIPGGG